MRELENWMLGYVVNAIWEAVALCGVAWLVARGVRRLGPKVEHRVWVGALFAQAILPGLTVRHVRLWETAAEAGYGRVVATTGEAFVHAGWQPSAGQLATLACMYAAAIVFAMLRLGWGVVETARLGSQAQKLALTGSAAAIWEEQSQRFGVEMAAVRVSKRVTGPVTVGIWGRLLLLPPRFAETVSAPEFAAAVAHECAHMQRWDFAKNLFYQGLCLPLSWHPALRFVHGRILQSREILCDDLAAAATAGRRSYAAALLQLAESFATLPQRRTLHAIGIFDANRFEERVMRLIERKQEITGVRRAIVLAVCIGAGLGTCAIAAEMKVSVAVSVQDEAAAKPTARISGGVAAGQILTKVNPVYPQEAKDKHIGGVVILHAIIGKDGSIESLTPVSGPEELQASALEAVRQWKYRPYILNGNAVAVETTITVNYSLAK